MGRLPTKNLGGRPTLMTPETVSKLEQAYAYGCTDEEACLFADIGRSTLDAWEKKFPKFRERKLALKNKPFLIARKSIIEGMHQDPDLALRYMERKKKDEFSLKQEVEHSGNPERPIEHKMKFEEMSDDELNQFLDKTKKS